METLTYQKEEGLDLDEVIGLYQSSTLAERRPVENRRIMQYMIDNAGIIVTARDQNKLVGLARTLTDFSYVAYLADLAVHLDYQKKGIGKRLVAETRTHLDPNCFITLLSAPKANDYYPRIGFKPHPRAWWLSPGDPIE